MNTALTREQKRKQRLLRVVRYLTVASAAIGGVVFFLFITASANNEYFERNYRLLLWLNAGLLALLFFTLSYLVGRLWQRKRSGKFGTRLMVRLALWFALIGVLPGLLIYVVSAQFLAKSLESWFNVRVDSALEAGLNLGRNALDALKADVSAKTWAMANDLAETTDNEKSARLMRAREQAQVAEAVLFNAHGHTLVAVGSAIVLAPLLPDASELSRVRATGGFTVIEGTAEHAGDTLRIRTIVPVGAGRGVGLSNREELFLQVIQPVPLTLASNAEAVQAVYQEYRQLALARRGLQRIFGITLTMTLLLAVFAALVAALLLAQRFARPLQVLAEGTRAVAAGDFRPLPPAKTKDEVSALTESFNRMTQQLNDARHAVEIREAELARTNQYLGSLLANISAGVLVFDAQFRLVTANQAAEKILSAELLTQAGRQLSEISELAAMVPHLTHEFAASRGDGADHLTWQHQFEIEHDHATLVLLARGSRLDMADGRGYVVVFDDISALISGQRAMAWSEVARRLAHEIKNPLTPIRLSAERLEMKLTPKLAEEDAQMLRKSTHTIVTQVDAMKRMVNEFRDYARMPPAELHPLDLNALIEETVSLHGQENIVLLSLDASLPWIEGDAGHLRQVIHNLVLNALDSVRAARGESPMKIGDIVVRTKRLEYVAGNGTPCLAVQLEVQDKGAGFSSKILARAFEPYITTKPRGTGLGLAIVRKIADEHGARIELANVAPVDTAPDNDVAPTEMESGGGALVTVTFSRLVPNSEQG